MGKYFSSMLNDKTWRNQLIKYLVVGGTAALAEWSIFQSVMLLNIHYLIAVFLAFIVATGVNYRLCKYFVFISSFHEVYKEITLLYLVSVIGLMLNIVLMLLMVGLIGMHPFFSKVLATAMVFIWNFTSRKIWVFGGGLSHFFKAGKATKF